MRHRHGAVEVPLVAAAVLLPPSAVRTTNAVAVFEMVRVRFDDHANSVVALGLDTDDTSVSGRIVSPAEQSGLLRCVASMAETHDATVEDADWRCRVWREQLRACRSATRRYKTSGRA